MASGQGPKLTILGRLIILLVVAASLYGAYSLFSKGKITAPRISLPDTKVSDVTIGVAYGTEKQRWLEWAATEFAKTDEGRRITVELIPMGSLEAAQAIKASDKRINVWSPASALYKDAFVNDWEVEHGGNPIAREESLALTPMVFVMWEERYQAFAAKYGSVSFKTVAQALAEPGGWQGIAKKPDWGVFKFGHTDPNQSNSGLMTLVLMANEFLAKDQGLTMADILDVSFQQRLKQVETAVSGFQNSTGTLVKDMVLKGPSAYDAIFVYENAAIDYLKNAEGRWGKLHVAYPSANMWNDNPYYVLNVPWSDAAQKEAAGEFADYLMSEPVQRKALEHGFRPGNLQVPIKFKGSPFLEYAEYGLKVDVRVTCQPPKAEVIANLLESWQRLGLQS